MTVLACPTDPTARPATDDDGPSCSRCAEPRLLIVPGLQGSGAAHWQSWLERRSPGARRIRLSCWSRPDLPAWRQAIDAALSAERPGPWIAVAHSLGCLAVLQHLLERPPAPRSGLVAALLVAPTDPLRHAAGAALSRPVGPLSGTDLLVLASSNDPYLPTHAALPWAHVWGARLQDLGDAGHVNVASGHGPWPFARAQVQRLAQRWHAQRRDAGVGGSTPAPEAGAQKAMRPTHQQRRNPSLVLPERLPSMQASRGWAQQPPPATA